LPTRTCRPGYRRYPRQPQIADPTIRRAMIINTVFICVSILPPKRFASWHRSPFFVPWRGLGEPHRAEGFTSFHIWVSIFGRADVGEHTARN
jgi:hypothetical protein